MSIFRLRAQPMGTGNDQPFQKYGLQENPFPTVGLDSGVLYGQHMEREQEAIDRWLQEVETATKGAGPIRPLAVYGSLGVGKTHLLNYLERGLNQNPMTPTLRKGLADEGATRLVLADLFLRYLPFSTDDGGNGAGFLERLVEWAHRDQDWSRKSVEALKRSGSPILVPFQAVVRSTDQEAVVWFSRWLRREHTTPQQRSKLGLAGVLDSEGTAVRAIADLMRLAKAANLIQVWFVFIDQLEELWRADVVSATRRARFLTDLRMLVDEAFEGAPIALLLAWNTTVDESSLLGKNVDERMAQDYRALWQRLGTPVNIPQMRPEDVWPFAEQYLKRVGVEAGSSDSRRVELYEALRASVQDIVRGRAGVGANPFAPRKVLVAWREKADEIVNR